ncbi:MAG: hypothetical protein U0002_07865 [Thermoanaerobaculia bacterium]
MGFAATCAIFAVSAFGAATLSVTSPGLDGTNFKLNVALNGAAGGPAYVQDNSTNNEGTYRALFWMNANTFSSGGSQASHTIFSGHNPGDGVAVFRVDMYQLAGGTNRIRAACRRNDGTYARTTLITIDQNGTVVPRQVQIEWAAGNGTGFCRLTRFGGNNPVVEVNNLTNDTLSIRRVRLGAVNGIDAGTTGAYHLDEFESYR